MQVDHADLSQSNPLEEVPRAVDQFAGSADDLVVLKARFNAARAQLTWRRDKQALLDVTASGFRYFNAVLDANPEFDPGIILRWKVDLVRVVMFESRKEARERTRRLQRAMRNQLPFLGPVAAMASGVFIRPAVQVPPQRASTYSTAPRSPRRWLAQPAARGARTPDSDGEAADADAAPILSLPLHSARQFVSVEIRRNRNIVTLTADPQKSGGAWQLGELTARLEVAALNDGILDDVVGGVLS